MTAANTEAQMSKPRPSSGQLRNEVILLAVIVVALIAAPLAFHQRLSWWVAAAIVAVLAYYLVWRTVFSRRRSSRPGRS